jgi:hypothetical protein
MLFDVAPMRMLEMIAGQSAVPIVAIYLSVFDLGWDISIYCGYNLQYPGERGTYDMSSVQFDFGLGDALPYLKW